MSSLSHGESAVSSRNPDRQQRNLYNVRVEADADTNNRVSTSAITKHVAGEFLAWVAEKKHYTTKLFRIASDIESALLTRWRGELYADEETLNDLCLATFHRERLEHLLNVLDFGGEYGVNFKSLERKRLFQRWLQITTRHKN